MPSHFYGKIKGQARTNGTRQGSKASGLLTIAQSADAAIKVYLEYNPVKKTNEYTVILERFKARSIEQFVLASGVLE